jgi:hypothetical protein
MDQYQDHIKTLQTQWGKYWKEYDSAGNIVNPKPLPPLSCVVDGKKIYILTQENVDKEGNLPSELHNDADEIHLYTFYVSPLKNSHTYYMADIKLPSRLKALHIKSNKPIMYPKAKVNKLYAVYFGPYFLSKLDTTSFDMALEIFMKHCYPNIHLPNDCKLYFGDREINVTC